MSSKRKVQQSNLKSSFRESFVEDASEDFENIEEHIPACYLKTAVEKRQDGLQIGSMNSLLGRLG